MHVYTSNLSYKKRHADNTPTGGASSAAGIMTVFTDDSD